jgi:hypothetical protein
MRDAETGTVRWTNSNSKAFSAGLKQRYQQKKEALNALTKRSGAGLVSVEMNEDFVPPLLHYLKTKAR